MNDEFFKETAKKRVIDVICKNLITSGAKILK